MLFGGIEAGGTKMVCAIGDGEGTIIDRTSFPTTSPEETFEKVIAYFKKRDIVSLGLGSFGPVDLDHRSATYGYITETPKSGWRNFNAVGTLKKEFPIPIGFDTDVNGAILGEVAWGAAQGCENAIYITIGTGVGIGAYINGKLVHGLMHPEAGHILLYKDQKDTFPGICPYHSNCMEGLASGPAIEARWGKKAIELADQEEVWNLEAFYIAQSIVSYILTYSPQKIILWGGVMHQAQLFALVRDKVVELLNGYVHNDIILKHIDEYIIPPALGEDPGIIGAVELAVEAYKREKR
ncbi:MAG: ROK family protein [Lachnospiraceae bacterium]